MFSPRKTAKFYSRRIETKSTKDETDSFDMGLCHGNQKINEIDSEIINCRILRGQCS